MYNSHPVICLMHSISKCIYTPCIHFTGTEFTSAESITLLLCVLSYSYSNKLFLTSSILYSGYFCDRIWCRDLDSHILLYLGGPQTAPCRNPLSSFRKVQDLLKSLLGLRPRVVCRLLWHAETAESELLIKVSSESNCWLKEERTITIR